MNETLIHEIAKTAYEKYIGRWDLLDEEGKRFYYAICRCVVQEYERKANASQP